MHAPLHEITNSLTRTHQTHSMKEWAKDRPTDRQHDRTNGLASERTTHVKHVLIENCRRQLPPGQTKKIAFAKKIRRFRLPPTKDGGNNTKQERMNQPTNKRLTDEEEDVGGGRGRVDDKGNKRRRRQRQRRCLQTLLLLLWPTTTTLGWTNFRCHTTPGVFFVVVVDGAPQKNERARNNEKQCNGWTKLGGGSVTTLLRLE